MALCMPSFQGHHGLEIILMLDTYCSCIYKEKHEYYLHSVNAWTGICLSKNFLISENIATVLKGKHRTNNNNAQSICTDMISYVSFSYIVVAKARIFSNHDTISINTSCLCCKRVIDRPVGENIILHSFRIVHSKTINREFRSAAI